MNSYKTDSKKTGKVPSFRKWEKLGLCRIGWLNFCKACVAQMTVSHECLEFSFLTEKGRDFLFRIDLKQEVSRYE